MRLAKPISDTATGLRGMYITLVDSGVIYRQTIYGCLGEIQQSNVNYLIEQPAAETLNQLNKIAQEPAYSLPFFLVGAFAALLLAIVSSASAEFFCNKTRIGSIATNSIRNNYSDGNLRANGSFRQSIPANTPFEISSKSHVENAKIYSLQFRIFAKVP